jgi:hypothetical protein
MQRACGVCVCVGMGALLSQSALFETMLLPCLADAAFHCLWSTTPNLSAKGKGRWPMFHGQPPLTLGKKKQLLGAINSAKGAIWDFLVLQHYIDKTPIGHRRWESDRSWALPTRLGPRHTACSIPSPQLRGSKIAAAASKEALKTDVQAAALELGRADPMPDHQTA